MVTVTRGDIADLAAVFARAYLRLTQKAPNKAVFQGGEPQIPLDVSRGESPHVIDESEHGRPRWQAACSPKSAGSER